jgi:hypothetical protein
VDFTKAQILAARATLFVGPVVRTVINISRSKQWRQKTEKVEARHQLQPLNPEDLRGSYLGQTISCKLSASTSACRRCRTTPFWRDC